MRVLNSPIAVLLFVLGSTIAQVPNVDWLCQTLPKEEVERIYAGTGIHCPPSESEGILKEMCGENSSGSSYDSAKDGLQFLSKCLELVMNQKEFERDLSIAGNNGQLDTVWEKYCLRAPVLKECIKYATRRSRSCLTRPDDLEGLEIIENASSAFLDFICYNNGARISTFVTGGGMQCLTSNKNALTSCFNDTFGDYIPTGGSELGRLENPITPSAEDCTNLVDFQECTVNSLVECANGDFIDIINSVFDAIKDELSCGNSSEVEPTPFSTDSFTSIYDSEYNSSSAPEYDGPTSPDYGSRDPGYYMPAPPGYGIQRPPGYGIQRPPGYGPGSREPDPGQGLQSFVREKCTENGGPRAYDVFTTTADSVLERVGVLVNTTELEIDLKSANSREVFQYMFNKHCRKVHSFKKHIKRLKKPIKSCLKPKERKNVDIAYNVTSSFLRFVCHNKGDRIATFLSNNGLHCLNLAKEDLLNCAKYSFRSYIPAIGSNEASRRRPEESRPPFIIGTEDCNNVKSFQRCVGEVLRDNCWQAMHGKMAVDLIEDLIKETPCEDLLEG